MKGANSAIGYASSKRASVAGFACGKEEVSKVGAKRIGGRTDSVAGRQGTRDEGHYRFDSSWEKQDNILLTAGFEPTENALWMKNGVYYGREAALQYALRELGERDGFAASDHT